MLNGIVECGVCSLKDVISKNKKIYKEVWVTNHQAATTIQKWYRKLRQQRQPRQAKLQAKAKLAKMHKRNKSPEIPRDNANYSMYQLSAGEECRQSEPHVTEEESCEWDDLQECTSPTFSFPQSPTEHEMAFHVEPLNLQYDDRFTDLSRVYNFDNYLQNHKQEQRKPHFEKA